ncbi:hypothetical protein [Thalassospira sp. MCCC 1A01428]|uniref:hypothetical protein n=1 Tax=Thalassospira sp. MCCC 1A01428 TaxID=1470575 RepID=UPI000A1FBE0B|nr:hypothetical protein [Thalassospira sp. MCCC 1A01428]OSQ41653.1 hypothetical protein THS27_18210 [Thalassospira sp. MCCC 1A01428]
MSKKKPAIVFCIELIERELIYVIARHEKGALSVAVQAGLEPDRSVKPRIVDKLFAERAINRKTANAEAA